MGILKLQGNGWSSVCYHVMTEEVVIQMPEASVGLFQCSGMGGNMLTCRGREMGYAGSKCGIISICHLFVFLNETICHLFLPILGICAACIQKCSQGEYFRSFFFPGHKFGFPDCAVIYDKGIEHTSQHFLVDLIFFYI